MPSIKISGKGQANQGSFNVTAIFIALHKSYLLLITDQQEYGIGNVTLSGPPIGINQASSSPFTLFGLKNPLLSNLVGKTASKQLKTPVLSMVFIKEKDLKSEIILKLTLEAVSNAIEDIKKKGL